MRCRAIRDADVPQLTALWLDSFPEKEEAAKLFFERNLSNAHSYLAEENDTVIAAVYLLDTTICDRQAHYLCGAATRRDCRGRGVMTALLNFALGDAAARGDWWSVLLPANEGLYRFYGRLGYQALGAVCQKTFDTAPSTLPTGGGTPDRETLQRSCGGDKFLLWNKNEIDFAAAYYSCYGVSILQTERAFALWEQDGSYADVFYAVYRDMEELKGLLFRAGVRRFTLTGSAGNPDLAGCEPLRCGMVKPLRTDVPPLENVWIGLTLN